MIRHIVNISLLLTFVALSLSGILAFTLPFSSTTTRVHVVSAAGMVLLVAVHVWGRRSYFRKLIQGEAAKFSRFALVLTAAGCVAIIAGAMFAWPPSQWLMSLGYEARHSATIVRSSPLSGFEAPAPNRLVVRRQTQAKEAYPLSLLLRFQNHVDQRPAIAVWAETTTGAMIETLYLESELAFADSVSWRGALLRRDHILPIWRNRYTLIAGVGGDGEVDAASGATSKHSFSLDSYLLAGESQSFVLCVEINQLRDPNQRWPDPEIGQPSLLYTAYVKVDEPDRYRILELTAHGGDAEKNGAPQYDLENVGDAQQLVDLILMKLEK